jgi:hypothetical protein
MRVKEARRKQCHLYTGSRLPQGKKNACHHSNNFEPKKPYRIAHFGARPLEVFENVETPHWQMKMLSI